MTVGVFVPVGLVVPPVVTLASVVGPAGVGTVGGLTGAEPPFWEPPFWEPPVWAPPF